MTQSVKKSICGICNCFCGIEVLVENNRITKVKGDKDHPLTRGFICPKGQALAEIIHSEQRIRQPLKKNEQGDFEPITWAEALDAIAAELNHIRNEFGAEQVAVHSGQAGVFMQFTGLAERFCQVFGTPNFSTAGSQCNTSKELANIVTVGSLPVPDYENAACIVLWGYNPQKSAPAQMLYLNQGRRNGAKLIVIDPCATGLAKKADIHMQLRPGTDGALALGFIHLVIKDELYDREFVDKWTVGFDKLAEAVNEFYPEKVAQITGVPEQIIIDAYRMFTREKPANFSPGIAIELQKDGFQTARAISILQAITGNIDVMGGARLNQQIPMKPVVLNRKDRSTKRPIGSERFPLFYEINGRAQANIYSDAILGEGECPLKAMIVIGSNPLLTWPNSNKLRRALKKLKFLVVMDNFLTETARLAHIIIPGLNYMERFEIWNGAIRFGEERMGLSCPVIDDQPGLSECEFIAELARRLGHEAELPWQTEAELLNYRLENMGLSIAALREISTGYDYGPYEAKRYEISGFATPSGKVEIYSETLEALGVDPLPQYTEPFESPAEDGALADAFPLILSTGARNLEYYHSRFRNIPYLKKFRNETEPIAWINPETARKYNIRDGDMVVVENTRGSLTLAAGVTTDLDKNIVYILHGWDMANTNELTDNEDLDPVTGFPPCRALRVRIKKL